MNRVLKFMNKNSDPACISCRIRAMLMNEGYRVVRNTAMFNLLINDMSHMFKTMYA